MSKPLDTIDHLRSATEDDATEALRDAHVRLPIETPAQFVEAYNRLLDQMLGVPEDD